MNYRWLDGLKRIVGLKQSFRRTGPSSLGNIAISALAGTYFGYYTFGKSFQKHYQEGLEEEEARR